MTREVLCLVSNYWPGFKAGGALRSIVGISRLFSGVRDFRVLTSDRDLGDASPYSGIELNKWVKTECGLVFYSSRASDVVSAIFRHQGGYLYLNSFFGWRFSILPMICVRLFRSKDFLIVLAPRGEFSEGALNIKNRKKSIFLSIAKRSRLYEGLVWHASTVTEKEDILRVMGSADVRVAKDIPTIDNRVSGDFQSNLLKNRNRLKVCFISRISRKKNLIFALEVLAKTTIGIDFNIYGPLEDEAYFDECMRVVNGLPGNISVKFFGPVDHSLVSGILAQHHLFFFPTHGENYGHVIAESLAAGTPVLLSDQTPWRALLKSRAGWDLSLDKPLDFVNVLYEVAKLSAEEYLQMRRGALKVSRDLSSDGQEMFSIFS